MGRKKKKTSDSSSSSAHVTPIKPKEEEEPDESISSSESSDEEMSIEDKILALSKEMEKLKQEIEGLESGKLDSIVPELYKEMLQKTGVTSQNQQNKTDKKCTDKQEQQEEQEGQESDHEEPVVTTPTSKAKSKRLKNVQITDLFPTIKTASTTPESTENEVTKLQNPSKIINSDDNNNEDKDEKNEGNTLENIDENIKKENNEENNDENNEEERKIQEIQKKLSGTIKYALRKDTGLFDHPVTDEEAPLYTNIILHGIDLTEIQGNIEEGKYSWPSCKSVSEAVALFARDLMLMFANAFVFNRPGTDVWDFTSELKIGCFKYLREARLWPVDVICDSTTPSKRKATSADEKERVPKKKAKKL